MTYLPKKFRKASTMPFKSLPVAIQGTITEKVGVSTHKYHAKRCTCLYGHIHDSQKEAMWCLKLHELQKEGKIRELALKPVFVLSVNNVMICRHIPDFHYTVVATAKETITEVKGMPTPDWELKRKLFMALFPLIDYQVE